MSVKVVEIVQEDGLRYHPYHYTAASRKSTWLYRVTDSELKQIMDGLWRYEDWQNLLREIVDRETQRLKKKQKED